MTTIARIAATAIEIGMRVLSPSARLDVPSAVTKRISSVAYAVDEIASDEKTASAIVLPMRWCSCSALESGRPTRMRLTKATGRDSEFGDGTAESGTPEPTGSASQRD